MDNELYQHLVDMEERQREEFRAVHLRITNLKDAYYETRVQTEGRMSTVEAGVKGHARLWAIASSLLVGVVLFIVGLLRH